MDSSIETVLTSPYTVMGIAILIFIISLVSLVKRIFGFFSTLIVLIIAIASGYSIINYEIVHDAATEWYSGGKKDAGAIHNLEHKIEANIEEVKQFSGSIIEKVNHYLENDKPNKTANKPEVQAEPKTETLNENKAEHK